MTPRERVFALEQFGIKLGLDNISRLLAALGHPERAWRAVHVAGTNGKGSVTAMVERALRSAGHRTGRYTSPHLNAIEERIAVDGVPITASEFDAVAAEVMTIVDRLRAAGDLPEWPTFFEVTTAMAFEAFRRRDVEVAVVEVGLGGRFDATNVLRPVAAAITSIGLDHQRHLGASLPDIAREKAGVIKPDVPVVVGAMDPAARSVIDDAARRAGSTLVPADEASVRVHLHRGRATVDLTTPAATYRCVTLGLNGAHQVANAVTAARLLEICNEQGVSVSATDIVCGLSQVEWPARLEWLRLPAGRFALIDAAHNPDGAAALAAYARDAGLAPLPAVIAIMQDKDSAGMIRALAPAVSLFVATAVPTLRSLRAQDLASRIAEVAPTAGIVTSDDSDRAVEAAFTSAQSILIAGSILLAGPLRARLIERGAATVAFPAST